MAHLTAVPVLFALLVGCALGINIYGVSPTCGPEVSFSVVSINGTDLKNVTHVLVSGNYLDSSLVISQTNSSLSFFTPKLQAGPYNVGLCSQNPIFNCTQVCSNNCTTVVVGNTTNTTCIQQCSQVCKPFPSANNCSIIGYYQSYSIPPILLSVYPSVVSHKSNIGLYGKNFRNCGKPMVRVTSSSQSYDFPAWFNSSTELVFYANKSITGTVSLSVDGQHFDSLSATPITLSITSDASEDSESASPGGPHNLVWLYILLGIIALAAGGFLVYVLYRYKTRDDYYSSNW